MLLHFKMVFNPLPLERLHDHSPLKNQIECIKSRVPLQDNMLFFRKKLEQSIQLNVLRNVRLKIIKSLEIKSMERILSCVRLPCMLDL